MHHVDYLPKLRMYISLCVTNSDLSPLRLKEKGNVKMEQIIATCINYKFYITRNHLILLKSEGVYQLKNTKGQ